MDKVHAFPKHEALMEEAYAWVLAFNADEPASKADIAALRAWAARSPAHKLALEEAEAFWCEAELLSQLAVPLARARPGRWQRFFSAVSGGFASVRAGSGVGFTAASAWASVLLLGLGVVLLSWGLSFQNSVGNGLYSTAVGEQRLLRLRDDSQVQLDTDSEVRVAYEDGVREVYLLKGKAHFAVAKNPARPFQVYARDGLVRAVGTAFSVYLADENIEVLVDEGRVDLARLAVASASTEAPAELPALTDESPEEDVFLSLDRGQQAHFNRARQVLTQLSDKDLDNALAWRKGTLVFVRDPLSEVVYEVSRYTDTTIEISDPKLGSLLMGGRFRVGELDALFEVLEIGFGVKVIYIDEGHVQLHLASNE